MSSNNSTTYAGDHNFGPGLNVPDRVTFDFTLFFEDVVLSIVPSTLFLLLIPPRVWYLWKSPCKVKRNWLQLLKAVLLVLFTALQVANVVFISRSWLRTRASLAAAILALVTAFALCVLSHFEHIKTVRPSSIIVSYLILTLPFDGARLRTRSQRGDPIGTGIVSALLGVKCLILIFEALEKTSILLVRHATHSPEAISGLFSRLFFWWLNPLFRTGFRGVVGAKDLFTTDEELLSSHLQAGLDKHWTKRREYPETHTLAWVMSRTMLKPFVAAVVPRLALTLFNFMQPLLIRSIIELLNQPNVESADSRGYGLIAATGLIYVGLALAGGAYQHKANRMATMVRGSLVSAIYTQTLRTSANNLDESAAVTLMSSDVERICEAVLPIHNMWACPIEIGLAIWLLYREIGLGLLGPLIITVCATAGPFFISNSMNSAQKNWIEAIQSRIDTTAKTLPAMKGVKMLGLSSTMSDIIHQLRLTEVKKSLRMRELTLVMIAIGNMSFILVPGAAFTVYVIIASINGQLLDVTSAFTALSLIVLLVTPISSLVFTAPPLVATLGCFGRIQQFITLSDRKDRRLIGLESHHASSDKSGTDISIEKAAFNANAKAVEKDVSHVVHTTSDSIHVANLTLAWSETKASVINDISFSLPSGTLTMIVGPVGCGKSSLLQGLLAEIPVSHGEVYLSRARCAFVGQQCWIQNVSVQENIIGVSTYDSEWYNQVLYACALDTDIEKILGDNLANVGSAGAALSGGQKLRIVLARAVYSRLPILILDDVFSGLDATSEDRIFLRLLGKNGLLRRMGVTVLAVTHAAHRLPYADHIIALSAGGTISEQGTFEQLIESNGYVTGLAAQNKIEGDRSEDVDAITSVVGDDAERLNAAADLYRAVGDRSLYIYYARAVGPRYAVLWMVLMICYTALLRFPDLWIKFWTQAIASRGNTVNGLYLGVLLGAEVAAMIMLVSVAGVLLVIMVPRSAIYLHQKLLDTVTSAPLSFFTSTDVGQIVNRFSQDLTVIDMELPIAALTLAGGVCTVLFQAVLICISAAYFATVLPFLVVVMWVLQKFYLRTSRQIRLMDLEAKAPLYSNFLETLNGLITIRAFGWADHMEVRNMVLLDASQKPFYLLYCIQRWLTLVLDLLVAVLAVLLVGLIIRFRRTADAGFVGVALVNVMNFSMSLSEVIKGWTAVETSLGAISRIKSFAQNTTSENLAHEIQDVPPDWPVTGEVMISQVSACYRTDQPPALHDINLSISPGQRLGLCGASGAGKSSFVAMLFHMLEIQAGKIQIDGIDISTIPRQTVRERLTVITQEPVFLKGTIRQNLDPTNLTKQDSRAEDALQKVGLWPVVSNAGGLDVAMDPEELLSHGQRQLFCLARAMLRSSKILVLDEATASVDLETDRRMQLVIREHFTGCTIIAVAHRLQTIRDFDRIAVFEDGRIAEYGEPDVLLEQEGSKFRALWNA